MKSDSNSVALVTGGSRGIGHAVVQSLLDDGWYVHFCSLSTESVEKALSGLAGANEGRIVGHTVDIRLQSQVDSLVAEVVAKSGRIDCLVNNAGLGRFGPVDSLTGDDWRQVIDTNLSGAFYALRATSRVMIAQGSGWIINIASLAAKNAIAGGAAYNASKFGLLGLSDAAMLDLRHHGIRVTTILPGSVATDFRPPSRRSDTDWMLTSEDVARAVMDLLRYPDRALPSRIELRPTQPPRK
jgi:NAD(P)-dependent dehydrogenase (short-subunit alcohol dehydrogenase family)